jgi:hypothetical protein
LRCWKSSDPSAGANDARLTYPQSADGSRIT